MKKIFQIITVSIVLLVMGGCKKFLAEVPPSQLSTENFFKTEADALGAIYGVYASIGSGNNGTFWWQLMFMTDSPTDDMTIDPAVTNANFVSLVGNRFDPNNSVVSEVWRDHYAAINRANAVIGRVPSINMNEPLRNRIVGEAKFLRAFCYYHLVQLFGKVPLLSKEVTTLDDINTPQAEPAEVYAQIIKDLLDAEAALPVSTTGNEIGRATKGAAQGMLAKVYLINKQWQQAADKSNEVISSGTYQLQTNYRQVFASTNKNNREIVFAIQSQSGFGGAYIGRGNILLIQTLSRGARAGAPNPGHFGSGNGLFYPTTNLMNSFETGDQRRSMIADTYTLGATVFNFKPIFFKYIDSNWITRASTIPQDGNSNFNFMRYAEVLLIRAEALNEIGSGNTIAFQLVNQVRARVGLPALLTSLSQVQLRDAIYRERRSELYAEGQRFYDLKRTDRFISVVTGQPGKQPQAFQLVYPIPQREIDINPLLKQNTGY